MTVSVTDAELRVELTPFEQLMALRRSFAVPLRRVVAARVVPQGEAKSGRGFRSPGTHVSGRVAFGTWRFQNGTQFWAVRRADQVLVVDLRDDRFDRLVLEVPDVEGVAAELSEAVGEGVTAWDRPRQLSRRPEGEDNLLMRREG